MPKIPVSPRAARSTQLETSLTAPFEVAGFNPQFNDDATKFTVDLPTPACHLRFDQIVANLRNSGQAVDLKYDLKDEDVGMSATIKFVELPETGPTDQNSAKEFIKFTEGTTKTKVASHAEDEFAVLKAKGEVPKNSYGRAMTKTQYIQSKVDEFLAAKSAKKEAKVEPLGRNQAVKLAGKNGEVARLKESFDNIYEIVETRPDSYGSPTISCAVKVNDFIAGAVVERESYVNHKGVTVNYTRDDPHSGFVTKVEGDEFTIESGVVLKREALYGVFRKGGSMPHSHLYHVSFENRTRMTFQPRNAENGNPEEPRVPRVCLAPTPEQCVAGAAGDYADVASYEEANLYELVNSPVLATPGPAQVSDQEKTGEVWALTSTELKLLGPLSEFLTTAPTESANEVERLSAEIADIEAQLKLATLPSEKADLKQILVKLQDELKKHTPAEGARSKEDDTMRVAINDNHLDGVELDPVETAAHFGAETAFHLASAGPAMARRRALNGEMYDLIQQPNGNYLVKSASADSAKPQTEDGEQVKDYEGWRKAVKAAYPEVADKLKFKGRVEDGANTISAEVSGEDHSYGVYYPEDEYGVVFGTNESVNSDLVDILDVPDDVQTTAEFKAWVDYLENEFAQANQVFVSDSDGCAKAYIQMSADSEVNSDSVSTFQYDTKQFESTEDSLVDVQGVPEEVQASAAFRAWVRQLEDEFSYAYRIFVSDSDNCAKAYVQTDAERDVNPDSVSTYQYDTKQFESTRSNVPSSRKNAFTGATAYKNRKGLTESFQINQDTRAPVYRKHLRTGNTSRLIGDSETSEKLEAGVYHVFKDFDGNTFFERKAIRSDELLRFEDGRREHVLDEIRQFWSLRENFAALGLGHKRGVLMFGPPGGGKSCIIKQVVEDAVNSDNVVIYPKSLDGLASIIREFRDVEPDRHILCVLEDVDGLIQYSEHSMLELFDGDDQVNHVLFLATTNYPDRLPPRVMRSGRFDTKIEIKQIPREGRIAYLQSKVGTRCKPEDIENYADLTEDFSFAQMREFVAATFALNQEPKAAVTRIRRNFTE